ncbi:S8 family peptidase [Paenibacillus xylaniclasticus]|uniref:S8 family peptidase n=1 Tax=Paenibacillus xylaniclasticus TaxID=588083 RepID=UPI001FE348A1|nr:MULTISPECIES: S8 family peptidase [Paenibacillus]
MRLEKLFGHCVRTSAAKHTTRHLIGFRGQKSYTRLIRLLQRKGIKPVKTLRSSRVICCYVDAKRLKSKVRTAAAVAGVKFIEKDARVRAHALTSGKNRMGRVRSTADCPDNAPWNVCRILAPAAWQRTDGSGVRVAVIDTGIAKHNNLAISGGINTATGGSYYDDNGHGTHVAGIIAASGANGMQIGVAPKVSLYSVKALDKEGLGYISDIIQGINWCIDNNIQVINMSFGLMPGEQSAALQEAIQKAYKKGIVIVASAGNSGPNNSRIDEPASFPEAIAVAASTRNDEIASFSSRGKGVDITAPGSLIRSTVLHNGYQYMSGTSMACPHVAAGAALLLAAEGNLTPAEVAEKLKAWSTSLPGYSELEQGAGLLQLSEIGADNAAAVVNRPGSMKRRPRRTVKKRKAKA